MAALVARAIRPLILEALAPGEAYPLLLNQMLGGRHRMLRLEGERPSAIVGQFNAFRAKLARVFAAGI